MTSNTSAELLFLSQQDAIEAGVTDMVGCVERMEYVFELYQRDQVLMGGPGQFLHGHMTTFPSRLADDEAQKLLAGSRFGAMPAYVGGDVNAVGVKWYGSVPSPSDGTPRPQSPPLLVLTDPHTGQPLVVMDGSLVSTMRTGAMAGLGAYYFQKDAKTATVLGPGSVGQAAALAVDLTLESLEEILIYHPDQHKAEAFESYMSEELTTPITAVSSIETAVSSADVIIAAASRNPSPRIAGDWLKADSTVIQLGDLHVPLTAFDLDQIFCDIRRHPFEFDTQVGWDITEAFVTAVEDDSDSNFARSDIRTLHELIGGADQNETRGKTFLSSLGLPMEDVAWGTEVYRTAETNGIGQTLSLYTEPYFSSVY